VLNKPKSVLYTGYFTLGRKSKKRTKKALKSKPKTIPVDSVKSETNADEVIRLKITFRKGARIESVPIKKLEKIATAKRKQWELKDKWLILNSQK